VHVLVAPDKFKGSLTAVEVAARVCAGLRSVTPDLAVRQLPVADGGDGTVDAAVAAGFTRVPVEASGPTGTPVDTAYARRDDLAVVELACVCGLLLLPGGRPDPLRASSFGVGEVIRAAVGAGCRRVILGVGGSASTDGGAGMLQALGARLVGPDGTDLPATGLPLDAPYTVPPGTPYTVPPGTPYTVDLSGLDPALRGVDVVVASDVDNPLYGPRGAAEVFAPQKGAGPDEVRRLDAALRTWGAAVTAATGSDRTAVPGAGAAGGVGYGAVAALGAGLRPGIDIVLDLIGFAGQLAGCRLVVTGEGALDAQTLAGKAPAGVAAAARKAEVPVVAVAGRNALSTVELAEAGISGAYPLTDIEPDVTRCIAEAGPLLEQVAARIARDWLTRPGPET
jgi:glycerate kinase